jgi:hypothetical protein
VGQKVQAVGAFVRRIGVWKMLADITKGCGPEQSIANGMKRGVGIRMAEQAPLVVDVYATENEATAFDEAVQIEPVAYARRGRLFHYALRHQQVLGHGDL